MLVMARINLARFRRIIFGLTAMSGREVRVIGGGGRILRLETAFRFLMMIRGLLIMVRGIAMMAGSRILTGHLQAWMLK